MLKNRERVCTSLPIELLDRLKEYSKDTMAPLSKLIEKAVDEYLKDKGI